MDSRSRRAKARLDELIADAHRRLEGVGHALDPEPDDAFAAGWATSRAMGFLEACTIFDAESADELLALVEPLVRATDVAAAGHVAPETRPTA